MNKEMMKQETGFTAIGESEIRRLQFLIGGLMEASRNLQAAIDAIGEEQEAMRKMQMTEQPSAIYRELNEAAVLADDARDRLRKVMRIAHDHL